jgi:hypothetical protein
VLGKIEWTPAARQAIQDRELGYFSVSFHDHYRNERNEDIGSVLVGGGLVNRPFLRARPLEVALSADDYEQIVREAGEVAARGAHLAAAPMPPRPAAPVADDYKRWAAQSPYGGDAFAANHCLIDSGRAELDGLVRRQLAQTGGDDYAAALDQVLDRAASGVIPLSASARQGTGLDDVPAPGWRDRADVPVSDPEHDPTFLDTAAYCASRRDPGMDSGTGVGRRSTALERRHRALKQLSAACGETLEQTIRRLEHGS